MNYLAHLFLARPTPDSCFGNLLGDFQKGLDTTSLPAPVYIALRNHMAVDKFTDSHPWVRDIKKTFSPARRRFAGITLDVLFDHFLICHWKQFSRQPFDDFCGDRYRLLGQRKGQMPPRMQQVTGSMINNRWLDVYASLDGVNMALNRTASRIRFKHRFENSLEEILPVYDTLLADFPAFFEALRKHIKEKGPEALHFDNV